MMANPISEISDVRIGNRLGLFPCHVRISVERGPIYCGTADLRLRVPVAQTDDQASRGIKYVVIARISFLHRDMSVAARLKSPWRVTHRIIPVVPV